MITLQLTTEQVEYIANCMSLADSESMSDKKLQFEIATIIETVAPGLLAKSYNKHLLE